MEPETASAAKSGEILVFLVRNDAKCAECGEDMIRGAMITLRQDKVRFVWFALIWIIWSSYRVAMLL